MPSIATRTGTRQPPLGTRIIPTGRLVEGLSVAFNGATFADGVSQQMFRGTCPRVMKNGKIGALPSASSNAAQAFLGEIANVTGEITVLAYFFNPAVASSGTLLSKNNGNGDGTDPTPYLLVPLANGAVVNILFGRSKSGGFRDWQSVATVPLGKDTVIAVTQNNDMGSNPTFYVDGVKDTSSPTNLFSGAGSGQAGGNNFSVKVGNRGPLDSPAPGAVYCAYVWARILNDDEIRLVSANPWAIWPEALPSRMFSLPASATNYTLAVSPGTIALTGGTLALRATRKLAVAPGSFAATGGSETLRVGRNLPTAAGSVAFTGGTIALRAARALVVAPGSFSFTGGAVAFSHGYRLAVTPSTITFTGGTSTLLHAYTLPVAPGSFALTGGAISLRVARSLAVAPGSFSFTGGTITPRVGRSLTVSPGSVAFTGSTVAARAARALTVAPGSVAFTGQAVTLTYTPVNAIILPVAPAAVTFTGASIGLAVNRRLTVTAGAMAFNGATVSARADRVLQLTPDSIVLTGSTVALSWSGETPPTFDPAREARVPMNLRGMQVPPNLRDVRVPVSLRVMQVPADDREADV